MSLGLNLNREMLKRFVKDYNLPIKIVDEPYFSYYVHLLDEDYSLTKKLVTLQKEVNSKGSCGAFLEEYHGVRDSMIEFMRSAQDFEEYNTGNNDQFNIKKTQWPNAVSRDVYRQMLVNEKCISIDLQKANFSVLRNCFGSMVGNKTSYEDFVAMFTDSKYIAESKYTRQVIFGNLNPKRQVKIQAFFINKLLTALMDMSGLIEPEDILVQTYDEIVLRGEKLFKIPDVENIIKQAAIRHIGLSVSAEKFTLKALRHKNPEETKKHGIFYAKQSTETGKLELKGVPSQYFVQVYKAFNGLELMPEYDLVFKYENVLAKFLTPLFEEGYEII